MIKKYNEWINENLEEGQILDPNNIEDDIDIILDIDIELEDETGLTLDDEEEEGLNNDEIEERKARPPKLKKKQRDANKVKAMVTKRLLGPDSPLRSQINKIFKIFTKEVKKEARKQGVPPAKINIDKLTIKR